MFPHYLILGDRQHSTEIIGMFKATLYIWAQKFYQPSDWNECLLFSFDHLSMLRIIPPSLNRSDFCLLSVSCFFKGWAKWNKGWWLLLYHKSLMSSRTLCQVFNMFFVIIKNVMIAIFIDRIQRGSDLCPKPQN